MKKAIYTLFSILTFCTSFAGSFTAGNIVVVRVGDGTTGLSSTSGPVFLDEYTVAGTLVQSVALPTTANGNNHALTLSGSATTEGALTLSADGQYLVCVGFDTTVGFAHVASGATNRTIARIGADGNANTTTGIYDGSAYVLDNFRSGVTLDGTGFWTGGNGNTNTGGTWYVPFGSFTASPVQVDGGYYDNRNVNIFGGQLYYSANNANMPEPGIYALGTGTPTSAGQTATLLPGLPTADSATSPYAFWFFDESANVAGMDVLYLSDDAGGLYKYSLVGGVWASNGNVGNADGIRGMTAYATCTGINFYITSETGIYTFTDSAGYNATINGTFNEIIAAAPSTAIRGIAFAPGTSTPAPVQASVSSANNVSCFGASTGSINLAVTGGTTPISYNWAGGITTEDRNNLAAGTYAVTVSDASGCTATVSETITQPTALSPAATVNEVSCFGGNNGLINVSANGGTSPYTFNPGNLSNLAAGTYTITITDANSCTATITETVTQPLSALSITDSITNLPCQGGGTTGVVDITVAGGTPGYTYNWSTGATTQDVTGLGAGTYTVTVTDNAACTITLTGIVSQSGSMTITPVVTDVKCFGQLNGSISLSTAGGTAPYTYLWNGSDTSQNLANLAAGSDTVVVSDNAGCVLTDIITVSQPAQINQSITPTDESCYGDANGALNLSPGGGLSPYTFAWSNGQTTQNISNLAVGSYTVTITDANTCTLTASGTVSQPDSLALSLNITNATTYGGTDGAINLNVTGGTTNYSFNWSNGSGSQNLTGLGAGNYCVTITDANTCSASVCGNVTQPVGIEDAAWMEKFNAYAAGGNLFVNIYLQSPVNCAVELYDVSGKVLFKNEPVNAAQLQLQIPGAGLAAGYYLVRIVTNEGAVCKKVCLVK